jgi:hypothetical protein
MPSTAALGLRAHSGWAALVAVSGSLDSPSVIDSRILQLANPKTSGSKQPYHAAEPLALAAAAKLVARCTQEAHDLACAGLHSALEELETTGFVIGGCGILLNSAPELPSLERILASHALIHTAEGQLFRDALSQAAATHRLAVTGVTERELFSIAAVKLSRTRDQLHAQFAQMGRTLGPPWREDQKHATLAAWIVLASAAKRNCTSLAAAD